MTQPPVSRRRSLEPEPVTQTRATVTGIHETRRAHARYELHDRACLIDDAGREVEAWALNISRGGVRIVAEAMLEPGDEVDICVGEVVPAELGMRAKVVWVQEERDGVIAGLEFTTSGVPSMRGLRPLAA
jgi:PilZ domain